MQGFEHIQFETEVTFYEEIQLYHKMKHHLAPRSCDIKQNSKQVIEVNERCIVLHHSPIITLAVGSSVDKVFAFLVGCTVYTKATLVV